jgi:lipoprotein NlpD
MTLVLKDLAKAATCLALLALAACTSTIHRAPVEERGTRGSTNAGFTTVTPAGTTPATEGAKLPPGSENAGKPGYYTVKASDTLIRIGLETGQNWKDIARWNSLENGNVIEVGQVLRVAPPGADTGGVTTRGISSPGATTAAIPPVPGKPLPPTASPTVVATAPTAVTPALPSPVPTPPAAGPKDADDDLNWLWPANGQVISGFDEVRSKGLSISGKAGDPVLAAADGKVVYAGSGLRGYGNLVIVKHNNVYLTAYAHNQALLVKEEQTVKRGQKIAEMGSTDSDRVQLHFEIRKQGKPIDPAKLLPAR